MPPKHATLSRALREQIRQGDLREGDKLPSEASLGEMYAVSRTTVRSALAELTSEGLIRSESGIGSFVRRRRRHRYRPQDDLGDTVGNPQADHFLRTEKQRGASQTITVLIERCPERVARRMGVTEGDFVVVRRRVRSFDGTPYSINDSFYPRSIAEGTEISDPHDIARGVNTVLTELGHEQVRARDEIYIQMPDPEEIQRLQILPGTAVGVHWVIGFTASDRVVRVVRNVLPGDRHVILFDREKSGGEPDVG